MLDALAHFELSMGPMVMAARPPVGKDIRELAPNPKDLEPPGLPGGAGAHIVHTALLPHRSHTDLCRVERAQGVVVEARTLPGRP